MHKDLTWSRSLFILLRLQILRLRYQVLSRNRSSKRSWAALLLIPAFLGMHIVMGGYLHRVLDSGLMRDMLLKHSPGLIQDPLRYTLYEDVSDQGARLMILFLAFTLFSSLLIKLGSWQSTQRDAEWDWFAEQSMAPLPLFVNRCLVESLIPHWVSLYIWPFFTMLSWMRGVSLPLAAVMGFLLLVLLQALIATPRLTFELWLRRHCSPSVMRPVRAVIGLLGIVMLMLSMQSLQSDRRYFTKIILHQGEWLDQLPVAQALSVALLREHWAGFQALVQLILIILGLHVACFICAWHWLKKPLDPAQGWDSGRTQKTPMARSGTDWKSRIHPLLRRDVFLFRRDQHFMIQMLIAPLFFSLIPLFSLADADLMSSMENPEFIIPMALMSGVLFLLGSVSQILHMEGQGLWLLFTLPQPMHRLLQKRLALWFGLSIFYASLVLLMASLRFPFPVLAILPQILALYWGLGVFTLILGTATIFAYKPGNEARENRPSLMTSYGILSLSIFYAWFLVKGNWQQLGILMLLMGVLAGALWQKSVRVMPYLLDPSPRRQSRHFLVEAAMIGISFFLLQTGFLFFADPTVVSVQQRAYTFAAAGSCGLSLLYAGVRFREVPWQQQPFTRLAVKISLVAVLPGILAVLLLRPKVWGGESLLFLLVVPCLDELIFRGLFQRSLLDLPYKSLALILSALIYAVLQPDGLFLIGAVLGLSTGWAYGKTRSLWAPVFTHILFNLSWYCLGS